MKQGTPEDTGLITLKSLKRRSSSLDSNPYVPTELEKAIGYTFSDRDLLTRALTHSSYLNEHGLAKQECNERLEFLGDAILEVISSEYLYRRYPDLMEGALSKKRSACVSERSLKKAADSIALGESLLLGKGAEQNGGRQAPSILSDAFEALLAALWLDGGRDTAERLIHERVLIYAEKNEDDAKTALQELAQEHGKSVKYREISENGPEHMREFFFFEALVDGKRYGTGTGRSKKEAQTAAATAAIKRLESELCI